MRFISLLIITSFFISSALAQNTLIDLGSVWSYSNMNSMPDSVENNSWVDLNYDSGSWPSGAAHLGYGEGDEITEVSGNPLTVYVRHIFTVDDPSVFDQLILNLTYDDGAIVYLNGSEAWRINMPMGSVGYDTFSSSGSSDNAEASTTIANTLQIGNNILAVEIHQRSASSSDISFDFELEGNVPGQIDVTRGPYLQKASSDRMVVRWRTADSTESVLYYGADINNLSSTEMQLNPTTEHVIELTGLSSNTKYYYEIANTSLVLLPRESDMYFRTAPLTGSATGLQFWVLGDCGTANSNAALVRNAYYHEVGDRHTDGILFLGDNAYNDGTDVQYQNAIFNMYDDKLKNSIAWSCLGNHDGHSANSTRKRVHITIYLLFLSPPSVEVPPPLPKPIILLIMVMCISSFLTHMSQVGLSGAPSTIGAFRIFKIQRKIGSLHFGIIHLIQKAHTIRTPKAS